jgi:hypothetical protein
LRAGPLPPLSRLSSACSSCPGSAGATATEHSANHSCTCHPSLLYCKPVVHDSSTPDYYEHDYHDCSMPRIPQYKVRRVSMVWGSAVCVGVTGCLRVAAGRSLPRVTTRVTGATLAIQCTPG